MQPDLQGDLILYIRVTSGEIVPNAVRSIVRVHETFFPGFGIKFWPERTAQLVHLRARTIRNSSESQAHSDIPT